MWKPLLLTLFVLCNAFVYAQTSLAATYYHEIRKENQSMILDLKTDSTFERDDRANDVGRKIYYGYWRVRSKKLILTYYNKIGPFADSIHQDVLLYKLYKSSQFYELYSKPNIFQSISCVFSFKARVAKYYRIMTGFGNDNVTVSTPGYCGGGHGSNVDIPFKQGKVSIADHFIIVAKIYGKDTIHVNAFDTITETQAALKRYMKEFINYPEVEREAQITGTIFTSFIVDKEGAVTNAKNLVTVAGGPGLGKEVLRVLASMPKVPPHIHKGKPVKVMYTVAVRFTLD